MGVTLATHNGSLVRREHNIRNPKVVAKEEHIDMNGVHEIWHDEKIREAYDRIFGDAVEKYNERQKRADRKISNYYNEIEKHAKKHVAYEMIVGVYSDKKSGYLDEEMQHDILKDFVDGWSKRNPNLELIGAYYHADEQGEPHVHLDYVPVAHGYTRGMDTQNGLVKAFEEMGIEKKGRETAQIQWEKRENAVLERICRDYGLDVDHPREEGRKHLETEQYKAKQELDKTIDNTKDLLDINQELTVKRDILNKQTEHAVKRKEIAFKRSFKHDRSTDNWTYNKTLKNDLEAISEDTRQELKELNHTDLDIEREYQEARQFRDAAQKSVDRAKMLEADQERLILDKATKMAQKQLNDFLEQNFTKKRGKDDRNGRLEEFCKTLQLPDGKTVLQTFNEMENQRLEKIKNLWEISL